MYPYEKRREWLISSRFQHLVDIVGERGKAHGARAEDLHQRLQGIVRVLKVRFVIIFLGAAAYGALGASLVVAALQDAGAGGAAVDAAQGIAAIAAVIARIAGAFSGILTVAFLFVNRVLGQLEVDALGLLATDQVTFKGQAPTE